MTLSDRHFKDTDLREITGKLINVRKWLMDTGMSGGNAPSILDRFFVYLPIRTGAGLDSISGGGGEC
jgi:hypothetical protein